MLNKPQPIEIPTEDPFLNDKLNRKESAELLTNLLETTTGPFVLGLTSSWGRGKTTFINMWSELLSGRAPTLYFNAWSTDFSDDPLLSFIGEIESQIDSEKLNFNKDSNTKKIFNQVATSGTKLVKTFTPLAVKLMTLGTINGIEELKEIFDFDPNSDDSVGDFLAKLSTDKLNEYKSQKESMNKFREHLEEFSISLRNSETGLPLIIFVDELDRCKPTYTIELLETIKHIFSVLGVVFILSIDREQLENSLKSIYGSDLDTNGYLARFIDLEYKLPDPEYGCLVEQLIKTYDISSILNSKNYPKPSCEHVSEVIKNIGFILNITPRIIEQVFTKLRIILSIMPDYNTKKYSMLYMPLLLILSMHNKLALKNLISDGYLPGNLNNYGVNTRSLSDAIKNSDYLAALNYLVYYNNQNQRNREIKFQALNKANSLTPEQETEFEVLLDIRNNFKQNFHDKTLELIELSSNFSSTS